MPVQKWPHTTLKYYNDCSSQHENEICCVKKSTLKKQTHLLNLPVIFRKKKNKKNIYMNDSPVKNHLIRCKHVQNREKVIVVTFMEKRKDN